ncbi:nadh-ubiquinone oxidoreductase kda subunit [Diplodia corticola]|uniref:Nadh-ubiquinone oxidoreductase kDa subunit n=1 Tax=Diplodia corticola TaxID=236234 RepID=A0A1J9R8Z0_9PEZI|nr:nadh-ubiquinone oxidoreductase kda subunit [Diplodia corticola]OJD28883.1 nadh-ubiquinone oxidoreductase kda subunit [Diplodia corticola]
MRPALRLLAAVKPVGRVLEPGAPTGLTGLSTHAAPRSTLVYLYSKTLDRLKQFPESSVYRQSTEALTRHRLNIIERIEPAGLKEWEERVQKQVDANPDAFEKHGVAIRHTADGRSFVTIRAAPEVDEREEEWNGELVAEPSLEGIRTPAERKDQKEALGYGRPANLDKAQALHVEAEPSLTADQISTAEKEIGAGLIEEVIQVAEGELRLANEMLKDKVWEELCEKPAEGQWSYFERKH